MENAKKIAKLFEMLCQEYDGASSLGKKAAQKMFYFFERSGMNLHLRYGIHYYGPYSSKLDDEMYELECEGYITMNTSGPTHVIGCGQYKVEVEALTDEEVQIAENVISTFAHKSPLELEALSTMDYIVHSILSSEATDQEIIDMFMQVKGTKFEQDVIEKTLMELKQLKFIAA